MPIIAYTPISPCILIAAGVFAILVVGLITY